MKTNQMTVTKTDRWGHTYTGEVWYDGVAWRWTTNDAIPPADATVEYGIDKLPFFRKDVQDQIRGIEIDIAIDEYRKAQEKAGPPTGERLAEMRNAFGVGATVVDVFTGRKMVL